MNSSARRTARYLTLILVALAACTGATAAASGSSDARLLVKFHAGVSGDKASGLLAAVNAHQVRTISALDVRVVAVSSSRAQSALAALRKNRSVAYAEPDAILKPQELLPNDPSFPMQFAVAGGAWGWYATHTTQAWDITRGDPSVIVAILDTGLKTQGLSDYDGQVVTGWNVMRNSTDTSTYAGNHGTYVAGVVGLASSNGVGQCRLLPGCKVMPVQVGTDSGAYLSDIASGMTWAADHGARVANMSWAGTSSSSTLANAVAYARSKGVVVTAAAGNSNCDCPTYPSATPGVIGVAGTTNTDAKAQATRTTELGQGRRPRGEHDCVAHRSTARPATPLLAGHPSPHRWWQGSRACCSRRIRSLDRSAGRTGARIVGRPSSASRSVRPRRRARSVELHRLRRPPAPSGTLERTAPQILVETNGDYNAVHSAGAPQPGQVLLRGQGAWRGSAPLSISSSPMATV